MRKDRSNKTLALKAVSDIPEAVSFDGTSDYLSRSTDLVSNQDSKTFTFSCWVYITNDGDGNIVYWTDNATSNAFQVNVNTSGEINFLGRNSAGTIILNASPSIDIPYNTWSHFIGSFDLSTTLNRYIFVNDIQDTSVTWNAYANDTINFTNANHRIGKRFDSSPLPLQGRLSNLFLAREYIDLSIESNRRIFINEDGTANTNYYQDYLGAGYGNVMLSLPMKDKATCHINEAGTGDFIQNGLIETADVGANQPQCKASEFDGVDDRLSNTAIALTDTKILLVSMNILNYDSTASEYAFAMNASGTLKCYLTWSLTNELQLIARNSANTIILNARISNLIESRNYNVQFSIDLANVANRSVIVNGNDETANVTWSTYTDDTIHLTTSDAYISSNGLTSYFEADLGEYYFDTPVSYLDLATNNPFWDSETNRPIPVRAMMRNTGAMPLIAMPISADAPHINYGSGGNFVLNGGGLTGSRGASEFISRSAKFDGSTGYLSRPNVGASNSKTLSIAFFVNEINTDVNYIIGFGGNSEFKLTWSNTNYLAGYAKNSTGTNILDFNVLTSVNNAVCLLNIDMASTVNTKLYVNSVNVPLTLSPFINDFIKLEGIETRVGSRPQFGGQFFKGDIGFLYFTTDYIDFSQESERNKFVNQLGYPRDLTPEIEAGNIPTPLFYLKFDDPSNLGKNSGTGGDFVVNGSVLPGSDFTI